MMAAPKRPASTQSGETRTGRDILRYHLGGFAFVTPPTVVATVYLLFVPPMAMPLYFGGFLLALLVTFTFSLWLSDRVRGWDETDIQHRPN